MRNKGVSKIGFVIFIIFSILLIAGCGSGEKEIPRVHIEENEDNNEINDYENEVIDQEDINTNVNEVSSEAEVELQDGLEVVNGSPVGEYRASGITDFLVTKEYKPGKFMPDIYLEKEHPYITEINDKLVDFFNALYEVDYKTITADRHEPFFEGELEKDSPFLDISREQNNEVITEVKDVKISSINFESGMQKARIGSSVIYYVHQSTETEHPYSNKYLEGNDMIVNVTSDVEKIDGEWKVTHAVELAPKILEDEDENE